MKLADASGNTARCLFRSTKPRTFVYVGNAYKYPSPHIGKPIYLAKWSDTVWAEIAFDSHEAAKEWGS